MAADQIINRLLDFTQGAFHSDVVIDQNLARCKNSQLQYKMAIEFAELVRSLPGNPVFPNLDLNRFVQSLQRRHDQQEDFLSMVEANQYQPPTFSNTTLLQQQREHQQHSPPLSLQGQGQGSPSTSSYSPTPCSSDPFVGPAPPHELKIVLPWSIPSFDDKAVVVFGCDEAKSALHDAISLPLTVPASFLTGIRAMGSDAILLHGPPGTGKTSLARHTSVDFQLPLLVVTPGMLVRQVVARRGFFDTAGSDPFFSSSLFILIGQQMGG
jgi:hypothetical protein